jgi:transposase
MARNYRKYDEDFKQGAVELVAQSGKPIAQVARELGVNEGTLGNWCAKRRRAGEDGRPELSETERVELLTSAECRQFRPVAGAFVLVRGL